MKKGMLKTVLGVSGMLMTAALSAQSASAAQWSSFCWGQKADGVHCTEVAPSLLPFNIFCTNWATSIGATKSGFVRDTDVARLQDKQDQTCNYLGTKNQYACFFTQHCAAGNTTHSANHTVFAASEADAQTACVDRAGPAYLAALRVLPVGCSLSVKAVVTMP